MLRNEKSDNFTRLMKNLIESDLFYAWRTIWWKVKANLLNVTIKLGAVIKLINRPRRYGAVKIKAFWVISALVLHNALL